MLCLGRLYLLFLVCLLMCAVSLCFLLPVVLALFFLFLLIEGRVLVGDCFAVVLFLGFFLSSFLYFLFFVPRSLVFSCFLSAFGNYLVICDLFVCLGLFCLLFVCARCLLFFGFGF